MRGSRMLEDEKDIKIEDKKLSAQDRKEKENEVPR